MKLRKILLLGLLGICVPLTGCSDDEKEPANDPALEEVPHHPTSNFDRCPLLAHIDNPKLGIKEITVEEYRDGELIKDSKIVYSYDKEQRLVKITGISEGSNYKKEYEYDVKGRPIKYICSSRQRVEEMYTLIYDTYGFLTLGLYSDGDTIEFQYIGDSVLVDWKTDSKMKIVYSKDLYQIKRCFVDDEGGENVAFLCEWENGNCVRMKDGDGDFDEYDAQVYDDKVNIWKLRTLDMDCFLEGVYVCCKNNWIGRKGRPRWTYSYTDNGLVAKAEDLYEESVYIYTYLYY